MITEENCPFCERIKNDDYSLGNSTAVSFKPLNPIVEGHRLFLPRRHIVPLKHPSLSLVAGLVTMYRLINDLTEDYNLILNAGETASQTIEHLHLHYVPRRKGDGLLLPWTNQHKEKN